MPRPKLRPRKDGRVPIHREGQYFYGKTEKEAIKKYEAWKKRRDAGLLKSGLVRSYAAKWLPLHKNGVSDRTYNAYAKYIDNLIDSIGDMELSAVTIDDAKNVYTTKYKNCSDSTIKKARMLYIDVFDTAIENGFCIRNPFRSKKAQPDKGTEGSHRVITQEERQLIQQTDHPFRIAALIMLYAGLRRGEVLALDIDRDVDFVNKTITINRAVRFEKNQPVLVDPKTEAGKRTIVLFSILENELKGLHGLAAPSAHGGLMSESAFESAWNSFLLTIECSMNGVKQKRWYGHTKEHKARIAKAAELRAHGMEEEAKKYDLPPWKTFDIRPHDLRHTFCTLLFNADVGMKQAIEWMGHADEKMIIKIYDHLSPSRAKASAEKVEKLLSSCQTSCQTEEGTTETIVK